MAVEQHLKTLRFWLLVATLNHLVTLVAIAVGCVASDLSCQGDAMKNVLSLYAFTLFTPQLALEAIVILAAFLVTNSLRDIRATGWIGIAFLLTAVLLLLFSLWR